MNEEKTTQFGQHLTIDGYGGDKEKLNNKEIVLHCLTDLPNKLGMKMLAEPVVYWADANDKKDPGGWTGIVVVAESHISIHTFPGRRFVSADVYTCGDSFDIDFIINYFKEAFSLQDIESNFIKRGTRYPVEDVD